MHLQTAWRTNSTFWIWSSTSTARTQSPKAHALRIEVEMGHRIREEQLARSQSRRPWRQVPLVQSAASAEEPDQHELLSDPKVWSARHQRTAAGDAVLDKARRVNLKQDRLGPAQQQEFRNAGSAQLQRQVGEISRVQLWQLERLPV